MKKIENEMRFAVRIGRNFRSGNTVVTNDETGVKVYLHGNCIWAKYNGTARFTLAGWNTPTTRSRLNALGVDVRQKNYEAVYNGQPISSCQWYTVEY
jgi:hypothetical protein